MPDIQARVRVAQLITGEQTQGLYAKADHGTFKTHEEAQQKALEVANATNEDAIIVSNDEGGFQVLGVDEVHTLLPAGMAGAEMVREAPIVSFVASDPLTGRENIIGQQSPSASQAQQIENAPIRKTQLDKYAERYSKQMDKVLGSDKAAFIEELNHLQHQLEAQGVSVTIEMDDDVFEYREKLEGFKNMLVYANTNIDALKARSITNIAIVDEWDGVFGTKVDLEYDEDKGRSLEIGDDFLNDWGESLDLNDKTSLEKLSDELGETLKPAELTRRTEVYGEIKGELVRAHKELTELQQDTIANKNTNPKQVAAKIQEKLTYLEENVIPKAKDDFKDFDIKHERKLSLNHLDTFEDTIKALKEQLKAIDTIGNQSGSNLELNARLEKAKITLVKGVREIPDQRNYFGAYTSGLGNGSTLAPSVGINYSRAFGNDKSTIASVKAGTSAPLKSSGLSKDDIMLGLGVNKTISSRNTVVDGTSVGIGVGFSRKTPFMIGATASNSWYLTPYHGLEDEGSVVGELHATVGTYTNVGANINVHKQLTDKIDFEGYGEISLWNMGAEAEGEFALGKDKDVYLTGGIGTNKLIYAGVGFADKYELEVGLGGVSFGKDSNNLPGESSWEVGVRVFPLPMPFFRHNRVPGYQFTYPDKSTEYITPSGTFMTVKKDAEGNHFRQAYIPDSEASSDPQKIVYRMVQSKDELENLEQAPTREITLGPLGYLTVVENGETIVDDGLIVKEVSEAELGIITDQAGVLWFDKYKKDNENISLGSRRKEMPLPLYRAVHY